MVKVKSKKRRFVSKIWRKLSRKHRVVPKDPEDAQVQVGSSIERQHSEVEVSPEPSKSSASPVEEKKPPVKMVKGKSKKRRYVYRIWRKLSRKHRVVPEGSQVQVDTSVVRPQSKMEVLPEHSKSGPHSPVDQKKPSGKMVKVKSKKRRFVSKISRKLGRKHRVVPKDPEDAQVQVGSSIERQHSEVEESTETPNSTTSPEYQRKPPIRRVKVKSSKHKYGRKICRKFDWKCHRIPNYSNEAQVQADTSIARQRSEVEVSALLKRVHRDSMMASKEMPEPNAYNATTANTTDKKTEELPDHADTPVTPHGPGTMVKEVSWEVLLKLPVFGKKRNCMNNNVFMQFSEGCGFHLAPHRYNMFSLAALYGLPQPRKCRHYL
ncbi:uncharacterized protein LOC142846732 [Microtus pennsylvanicus]|uniref:uncharacterized protein LOC142846732 n=1 Tax=Microtus pennsylvanicus TaxID=10058 RepID=UPI003F6AE308